MFRSRRGDSDSDRAWGGDTPPLQEDKVPQDELFDTTEASPLFAGIPVPATHDASSRSVSSSQPAFFCFRCHTAAGQLLLARDGHRYCATCAQTLPRR
jgi:hypothetical protein